MADWNVFSNHGLVLVSIARNPNRTAREIGDEVGLTERSTHKIIIDLENEGYINRIKEGRQNTYKIYSDREIQDTVTDASIGEMLTPIAWKRRKQRKETAILVNK